MQVFIEPFNFSFFGITGWGIDLDYCDTERFALETTEIILLFLRLHPSTSFQTLLLTMRGTQFLQYYWLGHRLGLLWHWMVCLGNEQRSFCRFWDCIQVLHFRLFCWLWGQPKMEKLYTVSKSKTGSWLWLMNSLLPNSDLNWRKEGKRDHSGMT